MVSTSRQVLLRAVGLGIISGMRAASSPAVLSYHASRNPQGFRGTIFSLLASRKLSTLAILGALMEIVIDKLPFLPARTAPLPLGGRIASGVFVGTAVFAEARKSRILGALLGALSALVASFAFYYARRGLAAKLRLPDLPVALAEDLAVVLLARGVLDTYNVG